MIYILLLSYLIGSIPFGLILTKLFSHHDLTKIGSGNIGATNVLRTGNKSLAFATLILDALKGSILILLFIDFNAPNDPSIPDNYWHIIALTSGLCAIIGHCFPIWLKFKGGKGVATALGVLLAAVPYAGLAACAAWLITAKVTKISSLSALVALAIAPIITLIFYGGVPACVCALITALVFWRHKDNITRIISGTEPKIGQKT